MTRRKSGLISSPPGTIRTGKIGATKEEEADVPCVLGDLEGCRLTRDAIAKHCVKPWFQDYVTGGC